MTEQANHHKIYIVDEECQVSREASRGSTYGSITWEEGQGEEIREEKINLPSRGIDEPDGSYDSRRYNPVDNRVTRETKLDIDKPKEKISISASSEVGTVGGGGLGTNSSGREPKVQRVARVLRASRTDDSCYDPLIVSIGPYHCKNAKLQTMEKHKVAMMQHFVRHSLKQREVSQVYDEVIDVLTEARECYVMGDTKDDDENFSNLKRFQYIMFVDGCFLVQFILSKTTGRENRSSMTVVHDALLVRDMFLLENQLPFSVIKRMMRLKYRDDTIIFFIIKSFINWAWPIKEQQYQDSSEGMTMKCSAWCRYFSRVWRRRVEDGLDRVLPDNSRLWDMPQEPVHLLQAMQMRLIGPSSGVAVDHGDDESWYSYRWRSATELKAAGIKFRCGKSHQLNGMHFMKSPFCGILTMTPMRINDATEPILMNLVALEALPSDGVAADQLLVTSYIGFLDSLIDHAGDVKELRSKGIIDNALGSDEQVAHLFNRIGEGLSYNHKAFLNVQNDIDEHYKNRWKIWINQWLDAHFSSPWTILAFLGALFVVALSATQTYYTVYTPRDKT